MLSVPGVFELLAIVVVLVPAVALLRSRGYSRARWLLAASACLSAAAMFTPADLLSQLLLSIPLFTMLVLGSRMRLFDSPVAS